MLLVYVKRPSKLHHRVVAPKYTSFLPFAMDQFVMNLSLGPIEVYFEEQKRHHNRESNFHWTGRNLIIFGTPLTVRLTRMNRDTRTGLHSIARDTFQTQLFSFH